MSRSPRITPPRILLLAFAVVAVAAAAEKPAPREEPAERPPASGEAAPAPAPAAGLRGRIDPESGRLLARDEEPVDGRIAGSGAGIDHWLNTYSGDLLEVPLPDGGYMVDLQGRFQSAVVVTIDAESGATTDVDCVAAPPREAEDER